MNLKLMNWCQTERMNLKYVEINWNVIFSKIILILILKRKRVVPVQLYIIIMSKGDKSGTPFPWCNMAKQTALCNGWKWVAAPPTPQQLTYAAGGTSILVHSGRRVKHLYKLKFCTSVNVANIIICAKSHLQNVADIYIRDIKCLSKLNFCTSVNVADIIICAKRHVIIVADNYNGTIKNSIWIPGEIFQSGVMLLIINAYTIFCTTCCLMVFM